MRIICIEFRILKNITLSLFVRHRSHLLIYGEVGHFTEYIKTQIIIPYWQPPVREEYFPFFALSSVSVSCIDLASFAVGCPWKKVRLTGKLC